MLACTRPFVGFCSATPCKMLETMESAHRGLEKSVGLAHGAGGAPKTNCTLWRQGRGWESWCLSLLSLEL